MTSQQKSFRKNYVRAARWGRLLSWRNTTPRLNKPGRLFLMEVLRLKRVLEYISAFTVESSHLTGTPYEWLHGDPKKRSTWVSLRSFEFAIFWVLVRARLSTPSMLFLWAGSNDVPTFHRQLLCDPKSLHLQLNNTVGSWSQLPYAAFWVYLKHRGTHRAVTFLRFKSSRIMRQIVLRLTSFIISSRIINLSCQTVKWQSSSSNTRTPAIMSVLRASLGLPSQSSLVTFVHPSWIGVSIFSQFVLTLYDHHTLHKFSGRFHGATTCNFVYIDIVLRFVLRHWTLMLISWAMAIVLMHALYYMDCLETLSVFSNNATLNFSTFWPRSNALFSHSKNGKLTSETTLVLFVGLHQGLLLPKPPNDGQWVKARDRTYFLGIRQEDFTVCYRKSFDSSRCGDWNQWWSHRNSPSLNFHISFLSINFLDSWFFNFFYHERLIWMTLYYTKMLQSSEKYSQKW